MMTRYLKKLFSVGLTVAFVWTASVGLAGSNGQGLKQLASIREFGVHAAATQVIQTGPSLYYASGYAFDADVATFAGLVARVADGRIDWQRTVRYSDSNTIFSDAVSLQRDRIVVAGVTKYIPGGLNEQGAALVMALDASGVEIWAKEITFGDLASFSFLQRVGANDILAIGSTRSRAESIINPRDTAFVVRLNEGGGIIYSKLVNIPSSFRLTTASKLSDKRFLIFGQVFRRDRSVGILKTVVIDDNGEIIGQSDEEPEFDLKEIEAFSTTSDGGAILIGVGTRRFAVKIANDGRIEWAKDLTIKNVCGIRGLQGKRDGSFDAIAIGCDKHAEKAFFVKIGRQFRTMSLKRLPELGGTTLTRARLDDSRSLLILASKKLNLQETETLIFSREP